jgi:protein YIPF6
LILGLADLNDFDDPIESNNPRAALTGNIGQSSTSGGSSSSSSRPLNQSYLTSRIPGDDRAVAYNNTIDEPVWATLRRDLLAIWGKLREVLWPRYLFGGTMFEPGLHGAYAGLRGDQGEGGASLLGNARDELGTLAGRVLDPEALLSANNMTPGLRDWDLWGPLLFSLLLSVLLTINRSDQKDEVFSGVFAMVWIGEAVVTLQIKLLGGNM